MKRVLVLVLFVLAAVACRRIWMPNGILLSADATAETPFRAEIFWRETAEEPFAPGQSVSVPVDSPSLRTGVFLPADRLAGIRIDFGCRPGTVSLSNIRLAGTVLENLPADAFSFSPDVESHSVSGGGTLRIFSQRDDPYAVCGRTFGVRGCFQPAVLWNQSPLVLCLFVLLFLAARFAAGLCLAAGEAFRDGWRSGSIRKDPDGRIVSFDGLRTAAFLAVVFSHLLIHADVSSFFPHGSQMSAQWGKFGVSFFFVLSGASLSIGSFRTGSRFDDFFLRRLRSILPPFWVAYAVCALVEFWLRGRTVVGTNVLFAGPTAVGLDGYLYSRFPVYYLVGEWFIGCLLILYLLAPAVNALVVRRPWAALIGFFALSALSLYASPVLSRAFPFWNPVPNYNASSNVFDFSFGMVFFRFIRPRFRRYAALAGVSLAFLLACRFLPFGRLFEISPLGTLQTVAAFSILCFALDLVAVGEETRRAVGFLGSMSYLAFLYHHRVLVWLVEPRAGLDGLRLGYAMALVVAVSFLLAWCSLRPAEVLARIVFGGRNARNGKPGLPGAGP